MRRKRKITKNLNKELDPKSELVMDSYASEAQSIMNSVLKLNKVKEDNTVLKTEKNNENLTKRPRRNRKNKEDISIKNNKVKESDIEPDNNVVQNNSNINKQNITNKSPNSRVKKRKSIGTKMTLMDTSENIFKAKLEIFTDGNGDKNNKRLNQKQKKKKEIVNKNIESLSAVDEIKLNENKKKLTDNSKNNELSTHFENIEKHSKNMNNRKINSESSESEWEEVEETENLNLDEYKPIIPKEGVEITLNITDSWKCRKRKKREIDVMDIIRRGVNRFRKSVQIELHKVHLLCLLAHGFHVNNLLLNEILLAMIFSHIPLDFNITKIVSKDDISKLVTWYKEYFDFDLNFETSAENIKNSIEESIKNCKVINKRDYNIIFILLVRSLGLEARLCLSLYPLPIRSDNLLQNKNKKLNSKNENCKNSLEKNEDKSECFRKRKKKVKQTKTIECNIKKQNNVDEMKLKNAVQNPIESNSDSDFKTYENTKKYKLREKKNLNMKETDSNNDLNEDSNDDYDQNEESSDDFFTQEKKQRTSSSFTKVKKSQNRFSFPENNESSSVEKSLKTKTSNRKILSSDSDDEVNDIKTISKSNGIEYWLEIYSKSEDKWISVDCINNIIDKPYKLESYATQPVTYVLAFDDKNYVKDVTKRYAHNWMTDVRKLRVNSDWWEDTLLPFISDNSEEIEKEDKQLNQIMIDQPLPKTIDKYKNHPLYVLKRHLLKFQAIYPPDSPTLGFIRGEPVYARDCVHTLHSRETWLKQARIVRIGEIPYKIVKARPKWNKMKGELEHDLPLEIFGIWQTEKYVPPPAENGKVPRNEYGNVELYQPCMLPAGTVHLKFPGLVRIARKLNIDCAPAMIGFDGNWGNTHPVFDGVVVCEEFHDILIAAWEEDQEIQERKEREKREKRIYDNWKRLIKNLLVRERIKNKYCEN